MPMPPPPPPPTSQSQQPQSQSQSPSYRAPFDILASIIISGLLSSLTLGIVWVTAFGYLRRYPKDRWHAKLLVAAQGVLVTIESIVVCVMVVETCAVHNGDDTYALTIQLGSLAWVRSIIGSIVAFTTQLFMINRFMRLFRSLSFHKRSPYRTKVLYWSGLTILTSLAVLCFLAGLANPIYLAILKRSGVPLDSPQSSFSRSFPIIYDIQFISLLVLDVILTVLFSLKLQKSRTGFAASNRIIDVLLITLVRNGFLVTALQLTAVVISQFPERASWSLITNNTISKVYVLTVLAILTKPRDTHLDSPFSSRPTGDYASGPSSGSGIGGTGGGSCQTCRKRLHLRSPTLHSIGGPKQEPLNLTEFLSEGSIDKSVQLDDWQEGKERHSLARVGEDQSQVYSADLEYEPAIGNERGQGDIVIQVDRQKETFISPSDKSQQATRRPRHNVMGGDLTLENNQTV
ncbi:hypothetical protein L486_06917 [Kwoniella mangroviensis CBS 10435]|uniref:Uncharacterized protein n=1 Tax=Kwoniella mangroviensis CBS 10435 TaxID=1331196 RepID=A0A1B9IJ80_9TREE|nr:hypothetical protein L486_06917 [Kwoniella mangroviensis CBS 10435]